MTAKTMTRAGQIFNRYLGVATHFPPDLMRVTHAHPLNPAALAFVPFGIELARVRVQAPCTSALAPHLPIFSPGLIRVT